MSAFRPNRRMQPILDVIFLRLSQKSKIGQSTGTIYINQTIFSIHFQVKTKFYSVEVRRWTGDVQPNRWDSIMYLNFCFNSLTIKCGSRKIIYLFNGAVEADIYILWLSVLSPRKIRQWIFQIFKYQQRAYCKARGKPVPFILINARQAAKCWANPIKFFACSRPKCALWLMMFSYEKPSLAASCLHSFLRFYLLLLLVFFFTFARGFPPFMFGIYFSFSLFRSTIRFFFFFNVLAL